MDNSEKYPLSSGFAFDTKELNTIINEEIFEPKKIKEIHSGVINELISYIDS